ncbi:MAG: hypothetical protein KC487_01145, partial [Anaerolineae bacterium]|nr:hypothetical protein [Anaerolineae bacterium]
MEITHDFRLNFDLDEYASFRGEQYARLLARPAVRAQVESVFAEVAGLMAPAACYDVVPIEKYLHDRVRLAGGVMLGGGPVVEVIGGAE